MTKLIKKYYYASNGERKINCYAVHIPKNMLDKTDIKDNINIKVENNKIIIEKA